MIELFKQLRDLLREQLQTVVKMTEAGQAQCEALKKVDVPALNACVKELEKEAAFLAELEKNRLNLKAVLERQLDLPAGITLSELLPLAPEETAKDLSELLAAFQEKMAEMQVLNATNRLLAQNGLHFNEFLLKALRRPVKNYTYQGSGKVKKQEGISLFNLTV